MVILISSPVPARDLFETYASYKKATNHVIRWLTKNTEPGIERTCLASVRELKYFAECIVSSTITVPEDLLRTFRRALTARKRLTAFLGKASDDTRAESTQAHAYFNEVFEEVYHTLRFKCQCCTLPEQRVVELHVSNTFECLDVAETTAAPPKDSVANHIANKEPRAEGQRGLGAPSIADDALEEVTQLCGYLFVGLCAMKTSLDD